MDEDLFPLLRDSGAVVVKIQLRNAFTGTRYFVSQVEELMPVRSIGEDRVDYGIAKEWLRIL